MEKNVTGLKHLIRACGYSREGLVATFRTEEAFRQELLVAVVMLPLAFLLGQDWVSRALLISSLLLVLIVEIINSALEAVVDRFGGEIHPLSKKAKDAGSAAVFMALVNAAVVWSFMLLSRF